MNESLVSKKLDGVVVLVAAGYDLQAARRLDRIIAHRGEVSLASVRLLLTNKMEHRFGLIQTEKHLSQMTVARSQDRSGYRYFTRPVPISA